jgi:hypothetical protein
MTVKIKLARANGALVSYPASAPTIVTGSSIQINTANGLSGGPITTTGTIGIIANSGIIANTTGVFVNTGYISTLASNSASFLGNSSGTIANVSSWITSNATAAYTNAVAYVDGKAYVNTSQLSSNLANYQTNAGLSANMAVRAANSSTYANASISNTFTIGTSTYYVSSGNVGIGTSTPNTKLDVAGPIRSYNSKFANGTTGTNLILRTNEVVGEVAALTFYSTFATGGDPGPRRSADITSGYNTTAWGTEYLSFNVGYGIQNDNSNSTLERVRITGSGNVGIGNTSPDAKLAVTGTANVSGNVVIGGITTHNANVILGSSGLSANGGFGTAGQLLNSNGSATYWAADKAPNAYSNAVSYVDGKSYVNTSQLSSNLANYQTTAGLSANVAVLTSNNATFAYGKTEGNLNVNNALTANSSTFLGTANLNNIQTFITSNAGAAYTNAVSYVDGKAYVNTSQLSSNLANYALLTGATFSGNVRTQQSAQVDGNLVVSGNLTVSGNVVVIGANNLSVVDNMIYLNSNSTTANPDLGFAGNYNDGVYRHTGFFRDASDGVWKVFDSYLPEPDASPYIDTTNTSFKIANFQANVVYVGNTTVYSTINTTSFSGTANNTTNAFGKTEINLNVNNALTANSSTFLGTANLSNIQTFITSNASAAYTNAVAYVDGKSYVNTSQLSSNLANYQTTAGLASNVATLTANNTSFVGTISAANVVSNAQLSSNLANYQTTAGLSANVATLASNSATYANASISNTFTVGTSTYFVSNGNVGIGTNSPIYKFAINGGTLGSTLGSTVNTFSIYSSTGNADYLNFSKVRQAVGSDWSTAAWRLQQVVDVTNHGYIQFNGAGLQQGISFGTANTERMRIDSSGNVGIGNTAPNATLAITGTANVSGNAVIGGTLTIAGNITPSVDNSLNLGSASFRWANIYTGDLQLSNEGSDGNDIDHTTGSWTIQEGHENLYLINRKTGKKYMFVLKEV